MQAFGTRSCWLRCASISSPTRANELPSFTSWSVTATTSASTSRVPRRATRPCRRNARSSTALSGASPQFRVTASTRSGRSRNEAEASLLRVVAAETRTRGGTGGAARNAAAAAWRSLSDDSNMTSCSMHCSSVMRSPTSARVHRRATSTKPFVEAGGASSDASRVTRGAPASEKQWPTKLGEGRVGWNARSAVSSSSSTTPKEYTSDVGPRRPCVM